MVAERGGKRRLAESARALQRRGDGRAPFFDEQLLGWRELLGPVDVAGGEVGREKRKAVDRAGVLEVVEKLRPMLAVSFVECQRDDLQFANPGRDSGDRESGLANGDDADAALPRIERFLLDPIRFQRARRKHQHHGVDTVDGPKDLVAPGIAAAQRHDVLPDGKQRVGALQPPAETRGQLRAVRAGVGDENASVLLR